MAASAGRAHTCGVTDKGLIECFGNDEYGQTNGGNPKQATDGNKFVGVSAGYEHTCGVTDKGLIECFGRYGQTNGGKPKDGNKFVGVSAGRAHTCGVTDKGLIECFGNEDLLYEATPIIKTMPGRDPKKARRGELLECEGDCDSDRDCKGNLVCFQRDNDSRYSEIDAPVPGCHGKGISGYDYCIRPPGQTNGPKEASIKFVGVSAGYAGGKNQIRPGNMFIGAPCDNSANTHVREGDAFNWLKNDATGSKMSVYCTRRELSEATINNSYSICKDRDGNFVFHTVPGVDCNTIDTFKSQVVNNPSRMYDLFEYKRRREARRLWNAISDNLEDQPEFCSECDEGFQRVDNRCVPDFKSANAATESITLPQYESCGANGRILTQCEINKTVSTGLMTSTNCDYDGKTWHGCTECGAGYILDSKFKQCIRKGKMLECPQGSTLVPTDHQATNDSILAHNMGSFKCQHDWMNTFENFGHIYYCGSSNNPIKRAATDVVVQCIGTDTIGDADKITKGQLTWSDSKQGEECYCAPKDMQNSLFRYGWSDVWDPDDASKTYTHLELKSKSKPAVNLMYERERYGLLGGIGGPPGSERERREREQREQREREQRDREREQREREQREREQREREQREREQRERYGLLGGIGGPPGSERERREREQREQREREQRDREREQREREQREKRAT